MKIFLYLTISALCIPLFIHAQSPHYRQYTVNDGLPSATVYFMIQDTRGYMWFATENGLARFDGKSFKTFTRNDGLVDNLILRLYEDNIGRIWITSFTGKICYYLNGKIYNPENDSLLSHLPPLKYTLTTPVEGKNGIVYFGGSGNFFAISGRKIYYYPEGKPISPGDSFSEYPELSDYYPIRIDSNSEKLYRNGTDYYVYTRKDYYYTDQGFRNLLKKSSLPELNAIQYQEKIKDDLWFTSSDNGIFKIFGSGPNKFNVKQYLKGIVVNDIFMDNENNMWFSTTGKGVFLLPANSKNALNITKSDGLPQENICALFRDKDHSIWAGAINNSLYRLHNHVITKYNAIHTKRLINYCYDVIGDNNGNIYYCNTENLLLFRKDNPDHLGKIIGPPGSDPFSFSFSNEGNYKALSLSKKGILLATTAHGLYIYDHLNAAGPKTQATYIPDSERKRVLTAFISGTGKIWAARSDGLYRVEENRWIPINKKDKVLSEPISRIAELDDGNLLVTTRSKGIVLFDGHNVLQVISEKNGLASDICNRIFIDHNNIWVATARGVSQFIYKNMQLKFVRNYTTSDGLLSNEINDIAADNDTIYVATADGLTILPEIKPIRTNPPPVYINTAMYGPADISGANDTVLKYAHHYIKFNFIGITYQQPLKIIYKYRLIGSDDDWQTNSNGSVDYPALGPGNYIFEAMAKKTDSDWSLPARFHFVIKAPFWMQTWFYFLIYGLLLAGLGFAVYFVSRIKRKQNEKKLILQNRMVQLEQQALSALMNPHFIFNALNSIQQYLHKNDALSANKYLSLFAKLTRKNMEAVVKNSVSLEEELERLELYLNFEKLRFGNKLQYEINIPPDLETDEILIPPMVLQPFVENAIWHGIMPLKEGGDVLITASKINDKQYKIEIKDTGIGIETSRELKNSQGLKHNSKGMQLTIERLELWTKGLNTQFDLIITQGNSESGANPGTVVTIILPL